jgi:Icc-related predicted phosphoesterase
MSRDRYLFFATDVHGSSRCFRKWLNAAEAYGADVLILGGDITAKSIVPIERRNGGWAAHWRDEAYVLEGETEVASFEAQLSDLGAYGWRTTAEEAAALVGDEEAEHRLFTRLATERLREWVALAATRLASGRATAFAMAGNDDPPEVDEAFAGGGGALVLCDRRTVWIDDWLPMISMGDSTPTPWHTPRELPEPEYGAALEELVAQLDDASRAIFNLHCPPRGCEIDLAPELDAELNVQYSLGEMRYAPVGSSAVRTAIERYQPLVGLHGHVHEGRGRHRLGRTECFNPGSDYKQGVLRGLVLRLSEKKGLRDYTFTMG